MLQDSRTEESLQQKPHVRPFFLLMIHCVVTSSAALLHRLLLLVFPCLIPYSLLLCSCFGDFEVTFSDRHYLIKWLVLLVRNESMVIFFS